MKLIRTEDAAGQVLCHDITQIIPGEFKGARFRKGHIIQPEDIPVLLSIGKVKPLRLGEKAPASSTRTKPPRCCTRPLRARTSTAPSRKRARSSSSPTATAC